MLLRKKNVSKVPSSKIYIYIYIKPPKRLSTTGSPEGGWAVKCRLKGAPRVVGSRSMNGVNNRFMVHFIEGIILAFNGGLVGVSGLRFKEDWNGKTGIVKTRRL